MTKTCERLATLAREHADECEGLELEESRETCIEVSATAEGLGGTTYELSESYLRTVGSKVGYARAEGEGVSLDTLVDEALAQSRTVDASRPAGVLAKPGGGEGASMPEEQPLPEAAELASVASEAVRLLEARSSAHRACRCVVRVLDQRRLVSNSLGLSRACSHRHVMALLSYIALGKREMHNVTVRSYAPDAASLDLEELACRAQLMGEASLDGGTLESGRYPVVISGEVMCQMLVGFWQVFSGEKVATGQSFLTGALGSRIGSEALDICEFSEPRWQGPGCLPIDAQGVARSSRRLVDRGVFASPLTTLEWASELGLGGSTGDCDRRDTMGRIVPNDLTVVPGNLCVAPGADSLDALFAKMGDGVYITDISDIYHSFNLASGGVSTPVRGARVRDGRLAEPLSALSISDNLKTIFDHIVACGERLSWVDMEDLNAYWCGSPDIYVSDLGLVGAIESDS